MDGVNLSRARRTLDQACRKKFGSKKHLWEKLRSWIDIIIFETWEQLLAFALAPKVGLLQWAKLPP